MNPVASQDAGKGRRCRHQELVWGLWAKSQGLPPPPSPSPAKNAGKRAWSQTPAAAKANTPGFQNSPVSRAAPAGAEGASGNHPRGTGREGPERDRKGTEKGQKGTASTAPPADGKISPIRIPQAGLGTAPSTGEAAWHPLPWHGKARPQCPLVSPRAVPRGNSRARGCSLGLSRGDR